MPDGSHVGRLVEIGLTEAGMNCTWAERVLYQARHPDREGILRRLCLHVETPVHHNLPRRPYIRLVGRQKELAEVMRRLAPESRHWLVPIEGIGGVGKSALAMEVGWGFVEGHARLPPSRRFDAVIWVSAKREVLTAAGIEAHHPTLTNLDDIYQAIAEVLDHPVILRASRQDQPREVDRALRRSGRVLLILDNLETVDDRQVLGFLRDLPPPTKAVATMRFHENMPYPIRLKELDQTAARELADQECTSRNISLSDEKMGRLLQYTRGLPLAIWWAVGLMGMEGYGVEATLHHLREPRGDLLRFVFDQAAARLRAGHPETYYTLLALSFFDPDGGASLTSLSATVDLDEEAVRLALHRLLNLNLVNRTEAGDRFTLLPITRDFALAELSTAPQWERRTRERWTAWYLDYLDRYGGEDRDWKDFQVLEQESSSALAVIEWCLQGNVKAAARLVQRLWRFLYIRGHWHQCEKYTRQALQQAAVEGNTFLRLWLSSYLGWLLKEQGRNREARGQLLQVREEISKLDQPGLLRETQVLNYLGQVYLNQGDLDRAESLETHFLTLAEQQGDMRNALLARYYLARICLQRNRTDQAEREFRTLVRQAHELGWERAEGYCAFRLADTLIDLNRLEEVEQWPNHALEIADRWQDLLLRAHVSFGYAQFYQEHGQQAESRTSAESALDLYRRLGTRSEIEGIAAFLTGLNG